MPQGKKINQHNFFNSNHSLGFYQSAKMKSKEKACKSFYWSFPTITDIYLFTT